MSQIPKSCEKIRDFFKKYFHLNSPAVYNSSANKGDPKGKAEAGPSKINQPTPKRKPTSKVKKEVNAIDGGANVDLGGLTP